MMTLNGTTITGDFTAEDMIDYQTMGHISEFTGSPCVIVRSLDPDFSIILHKVRLIITEQGSPLAHLALIALEYGKTIIRLNEASGPVPPRGKLAITGDSKHVEIKIL